MHNPVFRPLWQILDNVLDHVPFTADYGCTGFLVLLLLFRKGSMFLGFTEF